MEELNSFESVLPPALVSLTPFTPSASASRRRLSSCFMEPSQPVRAKRQLAWVNLQGRLVGAEEASAARTIDADGGVFTAEAAAAWELFTPIQRVLLVAVISVAAAHSKKNQQIFKLQKSIQLRDKVLQTMEQKLDLLCQQVNDQPEAFHGCQSCQCPNHFLKDSTLEKGSKGDDLFKHNIVEPDERRMSCLSDWAPSVASSADIQLDTGAIEDDMSLLQKECAEKDVTIQKLHSFIQSSEVSASKRVMELEDIIRRKNTIIKKLRKDIFILEQKVMNLTRLGRRSSTAVSSSTTQIPFMADNLLYDMDSTTGPSSSDSDSSPRSQVQASTVRSCKTSVQKIVENETTATKQRQTVVVRSPLKEKSLNRIPHSAPPRLKPRDGSSGENRSRRRPLTAAPKRWI